MSEQFSSHAEGRPAPMLILTRRVTESLYIGDEVTITVLGLKGNQVRFAITAPREVTVDRQEVYERKQRQRQAAAEAGHVRAADNDPSTSLTVKPEGHGGSNGDPETGTG